jgi:hypothetical protein
MERKDPESTRFTYIMPVDDVRLFDVAEPGDRIEMYEERDEQSTGRLLTARVLDVKTIPMG